MKRFFKSLLFLLTVYLFSILLNCIYNNKFEGYTGFDWNEFQNNTSENKNNYNSIKNPKGYFPNSNSICNFPECNTFNGVENNWNQNIVNNNDNNDNNNNNKNNNYRVVTGPYDFFKFNIQSPNCCQYSQDYTSSMGCLCLTSQQDRLLQYRGGNRS